MGMGIWNWLQTLKSRLEVCSNLIIAVRININKQDADSATQSTIPVCKSIPWISKCFLTTRTRYIKRCTIKDNDELNKTWHHLKCLVWGGIGYNYCRLILKEDSFELKEQIWVIKSICQQGAKAKLFRIWPNFQIFWIFRILSNWKVIIFNKCLFRNL